MIRSVNGNWNSIEEAFEISKMNYSVEQAEIMNSTNLNIIPDKKVLYRGDNGLTLGVVGSNYGLLQNSEAFAFFDIILKTQNASITKIIEKDGGKKITLISEVKDIGFDARPGDSVGLQYRLQNSFDGTGSAQVSFYALRLVCKNGLTRSDETSKVSIRHSKNIHSRMEEALKIIAKGEEWIEYFKEISQHLTQKIVDKQMVENFLNNLFGEKSEKKKEIVIEKFEKGMGNGQGTAWDLYNGVTEFIDHSSRYTEGIFDEIKTLEYSLYGQGSDIKEKALELLLK